MEEKRVLVAYASERGSTAEIADAVGEALRRHGLVADSRPVAEVANLTYYPAVILGSAVYMNKWRKDAIIEKTSEAREGGIQGGLKAGPVKGGGGKKKQESIQEELIRTRTWFSAFDSWHHFLKDHDAIGTFDSWDAQVRDQLVVGDTIEFVADVQLSPLHKLLATFTSFAAEAGTPGSPFQATASELKEYRQAGKMMDTLMTGSVGRRNLPVYLLPGGRRASADRWSAGRRVHRRGAGRRRGAVHGRGSSRCALGG